ncbi:YceI family protein [Arenibacter latericius]|uniref:YceI family protein n=1 Tax=Arenibacter latericius TaxID=86104 RepID=UPI000478C9D2|nr:YceI family protein [Arenibacter latericius]
MKIKLSLLALMLVTFMGFSQEKYILSEDSELTITGTSTLHDWTVKAGSMNGVLTYGDELVDVEFQVDASEIKSERGAAMNKKMHGALKAEQHPKIIFKFQNSSNTDGYVINGKLTIAGAEKEVALSSEITKLDNGYSIKGNYPITLKDYGVEPPTAMFGQIVVGDEVTVNYNLVFVKE